MYINLFVKGLFIKTVFIIKDYLNETKKYFRFQQIYRMQ